MSASCSRQEHDHLSTNDLPFFSSFFCPSSFGRPRLWLFLFTKTRACRTGGNYSPALKQPAVMTADSYVYPPISRILPLFSAISQSSSLQLMRLGHVFPTLNLEGFFISFSLTLSSFVFRTVFTLLHAFDALRLNGTSFTRAIGYIFFCLVSLSVFFYFTARPYVMPCALFWLERHFYNALPLLSTEICFPH